MISSRAKRFPLPIDSRGEIDPASSEATILRMVGDGKRVLEVGCGSGSIARHLSARGNRVTRVDSNAEAPQEASDPLLEMLAADLDVRTLAEVLQDRRYDAVVVGSILEHVRDPVGVLRDARTFLSDGGFAIVSISNVAHGNIRLSLLRAAFDDARFGSLDKTHLRRFTLRSLRELCLRAGYRIDAVERTKVPLFADSDLVPRVREGDFGRDVIAEIRHDCEHDTLQFVLRALPVPESERLPLALEELTSAERRLADASTKLARLERRSAEFEESQARSAELRALLVERDAALAREAGLAEELRRRLASAERELAAARERRGDEPGDVRVLLAEEFAKYRERDEALRESLAEVSRLRAELADASRAAGEASVVQNAAEQAYSALSAQRDALEERLARCEQELSAAQASSAADMARLESALADARAAADEAEAALSDARLNAEDLASALRAAEAERDVLAVRLAELEAGALAREGAAAEAAVLREAVIARELELIELQHRIEAERAEFAQQRAAADESIAALRTSFASASTELLDVQHEIELEHEALARQQQVAAETLEALKLSSAERDAMGERVTEAEAALARLEQMIVEREKELSEKTREIEADRDALAARLAEAEASVEALWETVAERERELMDDLRALAQERDALAALLLEAEASVETLWETIAERERELLGSLRALGAERDALAARLAEAKKVELAREAAAAESLAKRGEKEAAALATVAKLEAELQRVRTAHVAAVDAFKRHVDTDVKLARAESTEIDGRIRAIQRSWPWSVKMLLVRARQRLPGGRARV